MRKKNLVLIIIVICALFTILYSNQIENFWFSLWHHFAGKTADIGTLSLRIPQDWILLKKDKSLLIARTPENSGIIVANYGTITEESVRSKSFVDPNNEAVNYQNFEKFKVLNYEGFLTKAFHKEGKINALISFPQDKLYFSFFGFQEPYGEFLNIIKNAKTREWNKHT